MKLRRARKITLAASPVCCSLRAVSFFSKGYDMRGVSASGERQSREKRGSGGKLTILFRLFRKKQSASNDVIT